MLREDMRSLVGHKGLYYHSRQRELYGYMLPLPTKSHAGTSHTVYSWHSWEKASLENPSILKGLPGTLPHIFPTWEYYLYSVQFSRSVVSDSLGPQGLQQARIPCPSQTPRAYSNSSPWSRWCHPTIILCRPLLLWPSIFPSIRVFSNESVLCIRWPKYCSFSFSISPSREYSGLISFRIDWLDLLAVQGTLSRVFSNTTVQKHQFFGAQPSSQSNSHIHTWLLEKP